MSYNNKSPLYLEDLNRIVQTVDCSFLYQKSILITGATGLIGTFLIDALMHLNITRDANIRIYALGRNQQKAAARLGAYYTNRWFEFIEQDIRQPLPAQLNIDYMIHGASNAHPLAYAQDPVGTLLTNVQGTQHVLDYAIKQNCPVCYLSTVEVYGASRNENDIFDEDYTGHLPLNHVRSCYPESKRTCEALCQSYINQYQAQIKIVRLCRIFGPTMIEEDSKASAQFIKKAIAGENIVLKSSGLQYYSYCYVADACSAILLVLNKGENGTAYNVSNRECNIYLRDLARIAASKIGKKVIFEQPSNLETTGFSKSLHAILDNTKLLALGWKPQYEIENAVFRTIDICSE